MSQNSILLNLLNQQAHNLFQEQPRIQLSDGNYFYDYSSNLQSKVQLTEYYILLNIYFLEQPNKLVAFIKNSLGSTLNAEIYLQSLNQLGIIIGKSTTKKYQNLKNLYIVICDIEQIRKQLIEGLPISHDIALAIPSLNIKDNKIDEDHRLIQVTSQSQNIAYANITLKLINLYQSNQQKYLKRLWQQITDIIGFYDLDCKKILYQIINAMATAKSINASAFVLKKCIQQIGVEIIIKYIVLIVQNQYYKQGEKLVFRNKIDKLFSCMENYPQSPNQQIFKMLAIMISQQSLSADQIFPFLSPSLEFMIKLEEKHVDLHKKYIKKCFRKSLLEEQSPLPLQLVWGELIFSSKLELLNNILLNNQFGKFKQILQKYQLNLDLLYCPKIIYTLSLLLQWIIDPLYKVIGFQQYFKKPTRKQIKIFPIGYFQQNYQVSNYMVDCFSQILQIGKSYIFANKNTFSKICRLFKEICCKNQKLPFQKSDVNKKIISFIANIIKRHLLQAIEYYDIDPSVNYELDRLVDCYKFKFQFQIFFDSFKNRQFTNLHLTCIHDQSLHLQIQHLNRISLNCGHLIKQMIRLMTCHIFSATVPIFNRIVFNTTSIILDSIISAIAKTPKLTKKVVLFLVFLNLTNDQSGQKQLNQVKRNEKYSCLVDFTKALLIFQKKNEDFIKIIIQYIFYKLSKIKICQNLKNKSFEFQQINFLGDILNNLLPIQLESNVVNSCHRVCLASGPLLKVKLMNKIQEYYKNMHIRKNLTKYMFNTNNKCIFDNYFYFILLKLNETLNIVAQNISNNISIYSNFYDKIISIIINIINIAHLQINNPTLIQHYFNIKIFQATTIYYKLPYQISFYIIRKSIRYKMQTNNYDWNDEQIWLQLKQYFSQHFIKIFHSNNHKYKQLYFEQYTQQQIKLFVNSNIFLLFWIQDSEFSLYSVKFYLEEMKMFRQQIQKTHDQSKKQILNQFYDQLTNENQKNYKLSEQLKIEQTQYGKKAKKDYYAKYLLPGYGMRKSLQKSLTFFSMLIQYCIFPRSMLSKSQNYYSYSFYYYVLKNNTFTAPIIIKLLCLLAETIASYAPFATLKQSSQLLQPQYSSCVALMTSWHSYDKFNAKLRSYEFIKEKMSPQDYDVVLGIIYQSQISIVKQLLEDNNDCPFIIKNKLNLIFYSNFIPFCQEHHQIIQNGLLRIKNNYADSPDLLTMIHRIESQIKLRNKFIKAFPKHVKELKVSKIKTRKQKKMQRNKHKQKLAEDPLKLYPELETNFQNTNISRDKSMGHLTKICEIIINSSSQDAQMVNKNTKKKPKSLKKSKGKKA